MNLMGFETIQFSLVLLFAITTVLLFDEPKAGLNLVLLVSQPSLSSPRVLALLEGCSCCRQCTLSCGASPLVYRGLGRIGYCLHGCAPTPLLCRVLWWNDEHETETYQGPGQRYAKDNSVERFMHTLVKFIKTSTGVRKLPPDLRSSLLLQLSYVKGQNQQRNQHQQQ